MKTLFLALCSFGLAGISYGQESPSPTPKLNPPSLPFLEKAPAFSQWTITTNLSAAPTETPPPAETPEAASTGTHHRKKPPAESTDQKPSAEHAEETTVVIKTKGVRVERSTASDGTKTERWCLAGMQITVQGAGAPVVSMPGSSVDSSYIDYSRTDFPGFDWISARNFKGVERVQDQDCYVFRDKAKVESAGTPASADMAACINTATRLPVTLQLDQELRTYHFGIAPTAMLVPPPEIASVADKWQKSMKQSVLMPAKP